MNFTRRKPARPAPGSGPKACGRGRVSRCPRALPNGRCRRAIPSRAARHSSRSAGRRSRKRASHGMQRRERRRQHVEDDLRILGESRGQPDRRPGRRQDLHHSGHLDQDGADRHERRGLRGSFIARMGSRRTRTDGAGHHGRQEQLDRSPRTGQSGPQTGRKRQDARNHGQPVRILQFDVARSRLFDRPLQGAPDRAGDHGLRPESGLRMDGERPRRRGGR